MRFDEATMIIIPSGTFLMGSTTDEVDRCVATFSAAAVQSGYSHDEFRSWMEKECPAHAVDVKQFAIARFPITNGSYALYCTHTGASLTESIRRNSPPDHPVWGLRHEDAEAYARYLTTVNGREIRLPNEAEWEYAARGPQRLEYPYGNEFDPRKANSAETAIATTTPVDRYKNYSSPFGVCDMAGNVEEWVAGFFAPYPGGPHVLDYFARTFGDRYRVCRGGSWEGHGDVTRCARRHGPFDDGSREYIGVRIACNSDEDGATLNVRLAQAD